MKKIILIFVIFLSACGDNTERDKNLDPDSAAKRLESEGMVISCPWYGYDAFITLNKRQGNKADVVYRNELYKNVPVAWTPSDMIFTIRYFDGVSYKEDTTWVVTFIISRETLYMKQDTYFIAHDVGNLPKGYKSPTESVSGPCEIIEKNSSKNIF